MQQSDINGLLQRQKEFFFSGMTKDIDFRIDNLRKIYSVLTNNENRILEALFEDMHKSKTEAYTSEIAYILKETELFIKKLRKWSKDKPVKTSLVNHPGRSFVRYEPYGIALIIGPWNYPFNLVFSPLLGSIAAGNCSIVKPSEVSENSSKLISELINDNFPPEYLVAVEGDSSATQALINENIDYVFFTGSPNVGKIIMKSAAEHLIPVTLELGGKNPCIVDTDIDMDVTARRIAWGKFFNAGQTCIAPDYLLVHKKIKNNFLDKFKQTIDEFYPDKSSKNIDYTHIISRKHFDRLNALLDEGNIFYGGQTDIEELFISPTLITDIDYNSKIMQEEIFGPLLPVLFYDDLDLEIERLKRMHKPLSIYFFSRDKQKQNKIISETSSGSVCINGTIHVIVNKEVQFGGVGQSGMGAYHGKASFETFSHKKPVLKKSFIMDLKASYPPYKTKFDVLKKIAKFI